MIYLKAIMAFLISFSAATKRASLKLMRTVLPLCIDVTLMQFTEPTSCVTSEEEWYFQWEFGGLNLINFMAVKVIMEYVEWPFLLLRLNSEVWSE